MPVLFPFLPDWGDGYRIERQFKTEIITSRDLTEDRAALRRYPRKVANFNLIGKRGSLAVIQGWLDRYAHADTWVPDYSRQVKLTADAAEDDADLTVAATAPWMLPGTEVLVWAGGKPYDVLVVDSAAGVTLSLTSGVTRGWPAGAKVYQAMRGRFDPRVQARARTDAVGQLEVTFNQDPGALCLEPPSMIPVHFDGRELWLDAPNWSNDVETAFESNLETLDFDRGVLTHVMPVTWNKRTYQGSYLQRTPAQAEDLIAFHARLRGQRGEFFTPTWTSDLSTEIGGAAGGHTLVVPGTETAEFYSDLKLFAYLIVFFRDGSYQANKVTAIASGGGNSTLTVRDAWTQAVTEDTAKKISWLPLCRLASDTLAIEFVTDSVAQANLSITYLPIGVLDDGYAPAGQLTLAPADDLVLDLEDYAVDYALVCGGKVGVSTQARMTDVVGEDVEHTSTLHLEFWADLGDAAPLSEVTDAATGTGWQDLEIAKACVPAGARYAVFRTETVATIPVGTEITEGGDFAATVWVAPWGTPL